jgi:hypothetical protein
MMVGCPHGLTYILFNSKLSIIIKNKNKDEIMNNGGERMEEEEEEVACKL